MRGFGVVGSASGFGGVDVVNVQFSWMIGDRGSGSKFQFVGVESGVGKAPGVGNVNGTVAGAGYSRLTPRWGSTGGMGYQAGNLESGGSYP